MSQLRSIACVEMEERIVDCVPAEAAALLEAEDAFGGHLRGCDSCRQLASDLAALASLPAVEAPEALAATALAAAGDELRLVRWEQRRALRRAALRIGAIATFCLPLSLAWALAVWRFGASLLVPLLPAPLASFVGLAFGLFCLGALSTLVFTLTLITGAAARPPRALAAAEV